MGYPTVDRGALARTRSDSALLGRITLMVDDVAQLDLIRDAVGSAGVRPRICLDVDASLRLGPAHLGCGGRRCVSRASGPLALTAADRGFAVVGVMFYEAQIAGLPDTSFAVRMVKKASAAELSTRERLSSTPSPQRSAARDRQQRGTGSIEVSSADSVVNRGHRGLRPVRADPVRTATTRSGRDRPCFLRAARGPEADPKITTLFGAATSRRVPREDARTGAGVADRLTLLRNEGAGEVQTPVTGAAAANSPSGTGCGSGTRRPRAVRALHPVHLVARTARHGDPDLPRRRNELRLTR